MRVLYLLDEVFATRERPLIERLEIGLADEGVRVVRAVPETLHDAPPGGFYVETATYARKGLAISRRARVHRLLDAVSGGGDRPIDLIHAMGGGSWAFAAAAARARSCPLALEVWRTGLAGRAAAVRKSLAPDGQVCLLCPSQGMLDELSSAGFADAARLTQWGVHSTEEQRTILDPAIAASIVVVGSGRDARAFTAAMEGLARALPPSNDARLYLDADAAHRSRVWPVLQRLGLTERASMIEGIEARRDLALMADVLLVPESLGEHRTIVLDAMGAGMAVLAAADARVSWLRHAQTAHLVNPGSGAGGAPGSSWQGLALNTGSTPTAESWAEAVRQIILQPDNARRLGAAAREYVRANFRASGHVASVMAAYTALTSAGTAGSIGLPAR